MIIAAAIEKMIVFYNGNLHDINHFLKVWAFAKAIGEQESLDSETQLSLELAAVLHDIACPLCREKYGNTNGVYQEREGELLAQQFMEDWDINEKIKNRVCYLVGHHHTYKNIDGSDYQILLEADFLVNANESNMSESAIQTFKTKVYKTETGIRFLNSAYRLS